MANIPAHMRRQEYLDLSGLAFRPAPARKAPLGVLAGSGALIGLALAATTMLVGLIR
jgi:hypothetical protein